MTSKEIIKKMNQAIKQFGEYSFQDKGASEVMDLESIANALKLETTENTKSILEDIYHHSENGKQLAGELVNSIDDADDDWWDSIMQSEIVASLY